MTPIYALALVSMLSAAPVPTIAGQQPATRDSRPTTNDH